MKLSERILNKGQLVDANEVETGLYGITEGEHYEIEQLEMELADYKVGTQALRESVTEIRGERDKAEAENEALIKKRQKEQDDE